jgi:hypothetical protein
MVEELARQETNIKQEAINHHEKGISIVVCFMQVSRLAYSSTVRTEVLLLRNVDLL